MSDRLNKDFLNLYIDFDFLPTQQQAELLRLIPLIYERLLFPADRKMPYKRDRQFDWPPLCILSADTTHSIDFKFKPQGHYLPSFETTEKGDLNIWLPRWARAPLATAAVLGIGMAFVDQSHDFYEEYIEGWINSFSETKEERQIDPKEQLFSPTMIGAFSDKTSPGYRQLKYLHREFREQINMPNIRSAAVNGYSIKGKKEQK